VTGVAEVTGAPVTPTRSPAGSRLDALFVVYLVLLVWTVLWKLEVPWVGEDRMVKVLPFVATDGAGASAPLEVVVNLLLFVPFGLYLGLLVPARRWWALAGVVAGSSLALEVGQYVLAVGRSDATDVVVNTAGGLVGLGLAAVARHRSGAGAARALTRACAVATAIALVVAGLYLASPWQPVHVHDVGPLARVDPPRTGP
jgi:glycopeptide antibiotics resistance protein